MKLSIYLIRLSAVIILFITVWRPSIGHAAPLGIVRSITPAQSIQQAIDAAAAGDTILLEDGIYYQQINITKPLNLRARNGGKATISGAIPIPPTFTKVSGTNDLYAAVVPWPVTWVMQGNRSLLNYTTLQNLQTFMFPVSEHLSAPYPGPHEGFAYTNGTLYLRLAGGADPANKLVQINRNESGDGITIAADDVVVSGLRIRLWPNNGITVKSTVQRSTIRDCFFTGTYRGIEAYSSKSRVGLIVEHNEFSGKPVYDIRRADPSKEVWGALYDSNLGVRFLRARIHGLTVRYNYVYDTFDGIEVKGVDATPTSIQSDLSYNVIQNVVDNPLEFDTAEKFLRLRVHHNVLLDGYTYLSMAPFQAGKLLVDHNLVYTSPERGLVRSVWLKTCMIPAADSLVPLQGITIAHNTVVLGDSNTQLSQIYTDCNAESLTYQDSRFENNVVTVRNSRNWQLNGFTLSPFNLVYGSNVSSTDMPTLVIANPSFVGTNPQIDFRLRPDSAAVNRGVNKDGDYYHTTRDAGTDLGAIEQGDSWIFPQPGPRWATAATMPQRPDIPSSINGSWMGFGAQVVQ